MLTYNGHDSWIAEELLEKRMWVDINDYNALYACIQNKAVDTAKLLLDGGMDFDRYLKWAQVRQYGAPEETYNALVEYWSEMQAEQAEAPAELQQGPAMGGQTLG